MADRPDPEEVKRKAGEYMEAVTKIVNDANRLGMSKLLEFMNTRYVEVKNIGRMIDIHILLEQAAEKQAKGKLKDAEKGVKKALDMMKDLPADDALVLALRDRIADIAKKSGVVVEKNAAPPTAAAAATGDVPKKKIEARGTDDAAREISNMVADAHRLIKEGKTREAADALGKARSLAARFNMQELKEKIEHEAEGMTEKEDAVARLKALDALFEENMFLSPEKAKKDALELVTVPLNDAGSMKYVEERIYKKSHDEIDRVKEALADAISHAEYPEEVKDRIGKRIGEVKEALTEMGESLPGRMGRTRQVLFGGAMPDVTSEEEKRAYFISKLDMLLSKIKEDVLK
ncbi:hypothetical protein JW898_00515 [Candidatus Woesearchaeota archaeon]|nr:hypothetical protein [Candidatus Woesearchaeota archaeon]